MEVMADVGDSLIYVMIDPSDCLVDVMNAANNLEAMSYVIDRLMDVETLLLLIEMSDLLVDAMTAVNGLDVMIYVMAYVMTYVMGRLIYAEPPQLRALDREPGLQESR